MSRRVWLAAEMTLRALLRRRLSIALFLVLPLAFYLVRHQHVGQSIRFLCFGVAWGVSTMALFATVAARDVDPRLCVGGWSWRQLLSGRVAALLTLSLALALIYFALVVVDRPVRHTAVIGLSLLLTTAIAVALGSAIGGLVQRPLEGALLLFIVAGLQFMADPATTVAHLLPFWSTRELGTYAIDGAAFGSLEDGLLHGGATLAALTTLAFLLAARQPGARRAPPLHQPL